MVIKITCSNKSPPIGGLAVVEIIKSTNKVLIEWGSETVLTLNNNSTHSCLTHSCLTNNDILRALAIGAPKYKLYGETPIERTQIDHWLTFALSSSSDMKTTLTYLDKCLGPITYLVSNNLTIADLALFNEIYTKYNSLDKTQVPANVQRWFDLINGQPSVQKVLSLLPDEAKRNLISSDDQKLNERKQEGKFVELPGAEMGKVVVRFPPEASGFLHIGHAKAALLNQYYQQSFEGTLIMRFDDTNPAKENVEFEEVILEDLKMLEVKPDIFTYSSDYFDLMLEYCEKMLKDGTAFVDDTPGEQMKIERELRKDSLNRDNSVTKNFELWNEMLKASPIGTKCCVRAKIDMKSNNGCLRDPTIYRCKNEPHPRTGTKYKVYPTYDFACPIVDAVENVTHTLRTMEYHDRDDQFYWFINTLNLRRPYIWEYARLNMTNTVLSKRKLTWFVEEGLVDGWDDPRFPTVRGVLRRGMTVEGLKQFIIAQGSSKSVVFMEWDKIWAINKKIIDPIAPRYTALEDTNRIVVNVSGITKNESISVQTHPKDPAIGNKVVWLGPKILIDLVDAEALKEGENATFINWGNILIKKINKKDGKIISVDASLNLEDKDFKKTLKLTWLCDMELEAFTPTYCVYFEHIISKAVLGREEDFKQYIGHQTRNEVAMLGDPELKKLKKGDVIQLQRRGFFKVDCAYAPKSEFTGVETPIVLFSIPDGRMETPAAAPAKKEKVKSISKPPTASTAVTSSSNAGVDINDKITKQGELVRDLKAKKAGKPEIDTAVKTLLELKADYKTTTGQDWKPGCVVPTPNQTSKPATASKEGDILDKIAAQGEKVRLLKTQKAEKSVIDVEIKNLLAIKAEYKEVTGKDWKVGAVAAPVVTLAPSSSGNSKESEILDKITAQGEKVRVIKSQKPEKSVIDAEVKTLLALKAEYKEVTGKDWKVGATASSPAPAATSNSKESEISDKITAQGEKVRLIKSQKAEKSVVDAEVKSLLTLKAEYKSVVGKDWKPAPVAPVLTIPTPTVVSSGNSNESEVLVKIAAQGEKVRVIKGQKPEKSVIDAEVKILLSLKAEYKEITGKDWKPTTAAPPTATIVTSSAPSSAGASKESEILDKIAAQGEKVRLIKTQKAEKSIVDSEVKTLLALKAEYKEVTGKDWKPGTVPAVPAPTMSPPSGEDPKKIAITEKINEQGVVVRTLKTTGGSKDQIDSAVKLLLSLKEEYKKLTGTDFPVAGRAPSKPKEAAVKEKKEVKPKPKQEEKKPKTEDGTGLKKQTRLGLEAKKEENLPDWYTQVLTKGEMIEYYDVSGCYILRHWSFAVWKSIKNWFDAEITKMGVKECYFPIFVSKAALEKEKDHIADFSPEVAWVTKSGDSDLAEHIAVRPTSETGMYPAYAKWIQSYRDLPLKLNQWNNVVRWEFKNPQPFLRTREFLWQEGHTAFATAKEAHEEVLQILDLYAGVYTDLMAIPVIKGRKTEKEKFAGGDYTTTVEAFISASGRAIQGATSHHLGQNFSKMFDIVFEDPETQAKQFVYQNSWGLTTRTIGVMIMVHADNQGLVLPPRVACTQAIIVPCGITVSMKEEERLELLKSCSELEASLKACNVKCEGDYRDNYSPGWKFNHWELKGVPIRIELGPKDMKSNQFVAVRRDTGEKITIPRVDAEKKIANLLEDIHNNMLAKATKDLTEHTKVTKDWKEFLAYLETKNIMMSPFCGEIPCEDKIKADSARDDAEAADGAPSMGAKSLCIPFEQPATINASDKCIYPSCNNKPKYYCLFGRSY